MSGPWRYELARRSEGIFPHRVMDANGAEVCRVHAANEDGARLIAEAGTVAHETGLTPRQLVEQRKELMGALQYCLEAANAHECNALHSGVLHEIVQQQARAVLAHARGETL